MRDYYWRRDWFESLRAAAEAVPCPEWNAYARYCWLMERGLRKDALIAMGAFVDLLCGGSREKRMDLVRWLLPMSLGSPNLGQLIPHPLMIRVVLPTLEEELAARPEEGELYYWRGRLEMNYRDFEIVLRLDPSHVEARFRLIEGLLNDADYSTHHLPQGFIGDPKETLVALEEAEQLLDDSLGAARLELLRGEIEEYRRETLAYIASRR